MCFLFFFLLSNFQQEISFMYLISGNLLFFENENFTVKYSLIGTIRCGEAIS